MIKVIFYCCPKPFIEEFSEIQDKAIKSWSELFITQEIVVFGKDKGVKEYCEQNLHTHVPDIDYSDKFSTPILSSIFDKMKQHFKKAVESEKYAKIYGCYINADIILLKDFETTLYNFNKTFPIHPTVFMIGKRWDWNKPYKSEDLKDLRVHAKCHGKSGTDYFVFEEETFGYIHDFSLGKFFWDAWLVGNCFRRSLLSIDLSDTVFAIHQDCPWYQGGKLIHDQNLLRSSAEGIKNILFENYERSIHDGTRWKSRKNIETGIIEFVPKPKLYHK